MLDDLVLDTRSAARTLRRYPVASTVAVLSLAFGIGATSVTLTVRSIIFHKPPPLYDAPAQLSRVHVAPAQGRPSPAGAVPAPLAAIWKERLGSSIAGATGRGVRDVRVADRTEQVPIRAVTPGFLSVLGVSPELGHDFPQASGTISGSPAALLSYGVWRRLFDGRPDAIGHSIWIDNQPYIVAGILPREFWFAEMHSPVWTQIDPAALAPEEVLDVVVRRGAGVTHAALESQLRPGLAEYARGLPADRRNLLIRVSGVEGTPLGRQVALVLPYLLGASVLLTLLIACANVAILMMAQWTSREQEIAIRASIGASRLRIVRSLLTESILIAVCGGGLGICAALALRGWIVSRGTETVFFNLSLDPWILAQTIAVALTAGIAAGIAPALYETRRLHANPLRAIAGSERVRQRWRHALVVFEITVTTALLVEMGALIDGYRRTRSAELGFDSRPLLTAYVDNPRSVVVRQVLEGLDGMPGVSIAAATTAPTYGSPRPSSKLATGANEVGADRSAISAAYFSALGVAMRAGRPFANHDRPSSRIAILNETLARKLFPQRSSIGERIRIDGIPHDVVGVVADYLSNPLQREPGARVFLPLQLDGSEQRRINLLIRAEGDPGALARNVARALREAQPGNISNAVTFDQIIRVGGQEILVGTVPLFPLIAIGVLLTSAGIYGVLAFAITRRSRELALRVALGATRRDLARLVTRQTASLVVTGCTAGIAGTFALSRVVRAGGGAGSIFDPELYVFTLPVVVIVAIGVLAAFLPARRAARIDPAVLLRTN
jgi:predicted permease